MERYRNAFENTGDSQKSSEAMFARKVILVEGESEVLILPYLFSLCGYDEVAEGVTIVRCGGKSELDRYYRLYSEFGILDIRIYAILCCIQTPVFLLQNDSTKKHPLKSICTHHGQMTKRKPQCKMKGYKHIVFLRDTT